MRPTTPLPMLSLLAAASLLGACASTPPAAGPRAPLKLTILHTNDHHGRFWTNACHSSVPLCLCPRRSASA